MRIWLPLLLLAGCHPSPDLTDGPLDVALVYTWDTGSLPPRYHRTETLRVAPDGAASLKVQRSYDGGASQTWPFRLDEADRQRLRAALQDAGLGTAWSVERDPPIGGASWTATVTTGGETVTVPAFVVPAQQGAKGRMGDLLRSLLPESVTAARDAWLKSTDE